jgi:hypothetical protein
MMLKSLKNLGKTGIIRDTDPRSLPEGAWTDGLNVRFLDNDVEKSKGEIEVYTAPAVTPYWLLPVQTESDFYWIYPSLTKCYVTDGTTNTNITREKATAITAASVANPSVITAAAHGITEGDTVVITGDTTATPTINGAHVASSVTTNTFTIPVNVTVAGTNGTVTADTNYAADAGIGWNGGILGSVPIVNNGVDSPQMWTPADTTQRLQSLTWSSGTTWESESKIARVIRPFKQFLVALDTQEGATRYRQRIRWSHPADSGSVPSTWDEADTTKDAGVHDLEEGGGSVIDCLPLGDTNVIYKDNKTIGMQFIGGQFVFRFYNIFDETGILTRRCVKSFDGKHFVVTKGDVIVHDGNTFESVINHRMKRDLFALIDATNYDRTFVSPNYQKNEMWICFPKTGSSFADMAFIWNYKDNTWTVRDLPDVKHIGYGLVDQSGADTWDTITDTWDSVDRAWGELAYSPANIKNLMAGATKFYMADNTEQSDGTNITAYVERIGLDFGDPDRLKRITRIWPRIECTGDITVRVGSQMVSTDGITWKAYTYSVGDDKIDCDATGRFIGIRVESSTNVGWSVKDLDFEYMMKGKF